MKLLYSNMKVFHYKEKLKSLPPHEPIIMSPVHVRIKPTNICNHNCSYCAYRSDLLQLGKDMNEKHFIPKDKMIEIIDSCKQMGVEAITFSGGGEPFCYPYLLEASKRLKSQNIKFSALTNGSKLTGEVAEFFSENAVWLRVSIDGWDNNSYSAYRNISDDEFTKVMNNMKSFVLLDGKCFLGVSIVIDKMNSDYFFELIKKLNDIGVNSVKISPCIISNDAVENNKYHMPIFQKVKDQIQKAIQQFQSTSFLIYDSYHEMDEKFEKNYQWCPYLQILPIIGADLNVYSCQDKAYNADHGLIGSIKNIKFNTFWFSGKDKFYSINPHKHCRHHCIANKKNYLIFEYLSVDNEHLPFV